MTQRPERVAAGSREPNRRGRPRKTGASPKRAPRLEILDAAGKLFAERGYAGTSTADIADAVGLTQPAIFYYFSSKDELFHELAAETIVAPLAHLEAMLAATATPGARLYAQIIFHVSHDLESPFTLSGVVENASQLVGTGFLDDVLAKDRRYSRGFRALIAEGVTSGQFRDTDPLLASMAALGMCNWSLRWFRRDGRLKARDVATYFADFTLESLLADARALSSVRTEAALLAEPTGES